MSSYYCPSCQSIVKDWREFVKNYPELAAEGEIEKPFECVAFRCGKRWSLTEILQNEERNAKKFSRLNCNGNDLFDRD